MKKNTKRYLVYTNIVIVYILYIFYVSFTLTNWVVPPQAATDGSYIYNVTELIFWIILTVISTALFFSMIYSVHRMGLEERKAKK